MKKRMMSAKLPIVGIIGAVAGVAIGYVYAKEAGAVLGFVIGLIIGRYFERR
jgi:hypothetical protein